MNPTPISVVNKENVDYILGIDLTKKIAKPIDKTPKPLFVLSKTIDIMLKKISEYRLREVKEKMIIYPKFKYTKDSFSYKVANDYIIAGYDAMNEKIDKLKEILNNKD